MISVLMLSVLMSPVKLERPHLTIAQGLIESKLNSRAVGSSGERGAWQVLEKYWGRVPKSIESQAFQAEKILNKIRARNSCNTFRALAAYNGKGKRALSYARKVRKCTFELALITMPEMSKIDMRRSLHYGTV